MDKVEYEVVQENQQKYAKYDECVAYMYLVRK